MTVVLGLLAFLLVLNLAAVTGWAPSTRDGRDWTRSQAAVVRRGPVRLPVTWTAARAPRPSTTDVAAARHGQGTARVVSGDPGDPRSDAACTSHAMAA